MVNSAFVKLISSSLFLLSFTYVPFLLHALGFFSCNSPPSIILTSSLQPSSPGDYYSSVESDLKVELTEKLFALDTEGNNSPANTEVCALLFIPLCCFSAFYQITNVSLVK